tara:strand:+ start:319 stop:486 length:168 start_codon:yes stop_codon:yes gene_type:complete
MKVTLETNGETFQIEGNGDAEDILEELLKKADLMEEDDLLCILTSEQYATLNYCY